MPKLVAFALFIGLLLMSIGAMLILSLLVDSAFATYMVIGSLCAVGGIVMHKTFRSLRHGRMLRRALRSTSPQAEEWIPMLYGDYTPYVIEAAERLGEYRDTTAVPALMHVLGQTVNRQPPGWREISEALVVSLGKMGDRRALPLLNGFLNVRGIGFLPSVRDAIDLIEPQTSLLRPASAEDIGTHTLLRPAQAGAVSDPALLLRPSSEYPA